MTKHLVIGSNSFSGQDFVDLLLDKPDREVIGVSRSEEKPDLFLRYKLRSDLSRFRFERFDLNQDMDMFLAFLDAERPSRIINFAARSEVGPSWDHPEQWFRTNCAALAEMINHLRKRDYVERYLHISSPEVYGNCDNGMVTEDVPPNPSTPYAASKAAADMLLQTYAETYNFPSMTVRATNVFGARQQLFKIVVRAVIYMKSDRKILLHGGGAAVKSYIHVRDVSRGELAILEDGRVGEIYHLSLESGISIRDVVKHIATAMGKDVEAVTETIEERPGQDAVYEIHSGKAQSELGWRPEIAFDDGIREVIEWVDANWDEIASLPLEYVHKP